MMKNNRQYFTKAQLVLEWVIYLLLIAALAVNICFMIFDKGLQVATHINLSGQVDRYGSVGSLLILPIIMLFCIVMISLIMHCMPVNLWNMPFRVNSKNAIPVYHCIIWMIVVLELLLAVFTLLTVICMIGGWADTENILTIILVIGVFFDIIIFCILAGRYNRM